MLPTIFIQFDFVMFLCFVYLRPLVVLFSTMICRKDSLDPNFRMPGAVLQKYFDTWQVNTMAHWSQARSVSVLFKAWMFSLAFKVLILSHCTPYTRAGTHSIACPNGNPVFDVECDGDHEGDHGCRNSCKITCSAGKKKVLKMQEQLKICHHEL